MLRISHQRLSGAAMDERDREIAELKARLARLGEPAPDRPRRIPYMGLAIAGLAGAVVLCLALVGLSSLRETSSSTSQASAAADQVATAHVASPIAHAPDPAQPDHFYNFREGDTYGYETAISEDDHKAGAIGDVALFQYLGIVDGEYTLVAKDGSAYVSCANPCENLRVWDPGNRRRATRVPFKAGSFFGGAISDAIAGKLRIAKPLKRR